MTTAVSASPPAACSCSLLLIRHPPSLPTSINWLSVMCQTACKGLKEQWWGKLHALCSAGFQWRCYRHNVLHCPMSVFCARWWTLGGQEACQSCLPTCPQTLAQSPTHSRKYIHMYWVNVWTHSMRIPLSLKHGAECWLLHTPSTSRFYLVIWKDAIHLHA